MGTSISSIPNAFDVGHRFVRPNWTVITDWVTARVAADQLNDTWTTLARDWLDQLRRSLPNEYAITESDEFLLLTKIGLTRFKPTAGILRACSSNYP